VDAKLTTECRAVADVCDVAEICDGVDDDCPTDAFEPSSVTCRPEAGVCDVAENCTGTGSACPADAVEPATTECRAVAGICDTAENCDGTGVDCPADAFQPSSVTCRPVNGVCDTAEQCTGTGANCPTDTFASSAVVCRPQGGVCDIAENCSGSAAACPTDAVEPTVTVCRPAASTGDDAETCDGATYFCPADAFLPAGTPCDDGSFCTENDEADGFGNCTGDPVDCDDANPCTDDTCDSQGGGFLCLYDSNGSCAGDCGNGTIDAGETCDPPNPALGPNGQALCRFDCTSCGDGVVQGSIETCDDSNTVSGCRLDKPQQPLDNCLNSCIEPICADPARIKFGAHDLPDLFQFHGRLIAPMSVDFINNHFVIELQDVSGNVLWRSSIVKGSIEVQNAKSTRYKNRGARAGGGIYQIKTKQAAGHYVLTLKAYGDLSQSVADMVTRVYVGSEEWAIRGLWTQQSTKGWKLSNKATFYPVP
jgi:cysteine-rich repeat protein